MPNDGANTTACRIDLGTDTVADTAADAIADTVATTSRHRSPPTACTGLRAVYFVCTLYIENNHRSVQLLLVLRSQCQHFPMCHCNAIAALRGRELS